MNDEAKRHTGGCLCGALRYEAFGEPLGSGHCYCVDCRRASGSGFIPFMGFNAEAVRFTGEACGFRSKAANGGEAVRNRCVGLHEPRIRRRIGKTDSYTIYAGSLDDPSAFHPTIAIFAEGRPPWAVIPEGLKVFERMPGGQNATTHKTTQREPMLLHRIHVPLIQCGIVSSGIHSAIRFV